MGSTAQVVSGLAADRHGCQGCNGERHVCFFSPTETALGGLKAIRVQRGTGNNAWVWLEYRQPDGLYDSNLNLSQGNASKANADGGAMIHYRRCRLERHHRPHVPGEIQSRPDWRPLFRRSSSGSRQKLDRSLFQSHDHGEPGYAGRPFGQRVLRSTIRLSRFHDSRENPNFSTNTGGNGAIAVIAPSNCSWTAIPIRSLDHDRFRHDRKQAAARSLSRSRQICRQLFDGGRIVVGSSNIYRDRRTGWQATPPITPLHSHRLLRPVVQGTARRFHEHRRLRLGLRE